MSSSLVPLFTPEDQDGAKETPKIRCLSRREMLGVMGSTAIAVTLAGCGGEQSGSSSSPSAPTAETTSASLPTPEGPLSVSGAPNLPEGFTGTLADDLVALMDALGHERFAVVGHDTGLIISYALAADHPDRVDRLAVAEVPGPLGVGPSPPLFGLPEPINNKLWHLAFNRVNDEMTEQLVTGREDIFFGYEFAIQGGEKKLPDEVQRHYFDLYSDPDALRGSFGFYRALDTTLAQNGQRKTTPLTMPVLAIGGAESWGEEVGNGMKPAADDVQSVVIPDTGHWVAEQAPEEMVAVLTEFLAPYREVGDGLR